MRISFDVEELTECFEANLMIDYDDGFVAYLNGVEMARSYVGKPCDIPAFNQLSSRSHEAFEHRYVFNPVKGFYIDSNFLVSNLKTGQNILAIQVHNDSIKGSDISLNSGFYNLTFLTVDYSNIIYNDIFRFKAPVQFDSSIHPIIVINTDEYGIENTTDRKAVKMGIIYNGEGKINRITDNFNNYFGLVNIKIRGKSSKDFMKRSYNFETQDLSGNNKNVSLLGLPAENDWILFGPFADKSQIRNELAFTLGRKLGHYEPRTKFCELIINDEYLGLYTLTEEIKIDDSRLDITKLTSNDNYEKYVTGGYIVRYDKLGFYVDPSDNEITTEQKNYIRTFMDNIPNKLNTAGFLDPETGYTSYIDTSSLLDYIIINEISKNADGYLFSTYFYKDRDDVDPRLKYGPLWDYDLGFGNTTFHEGNLTEGWQFEINKGLHITEMLRDTTLVNNLSYKWHSLRKGLLHDDNLNYLIDSLLDYISEARIRNYKVWPVIKYNLFWPAYLPVSYENEIAQMKNWIFARTEWIDNNIDNIFYEIPDFNTKEPVQPPITEAVKYNNTNNRVSVYPNPFYSSFNITLNASQKSTIEIVLYNILGEEILNMDNQYKQSESGAININIQKEKLEKGIYFLTIKQDNSIICTKKLIKQ